VKHARGPALDSIEDLLVSIRRRDGLVEKVRGVFYRAGRAYLHFHEDPAGIFADLREAAEWARLPVNTGAQRRALLARLGPAARARSGRR
jgi:hypothetical protein